MATRTIHAFDYAPKDSGLGGSGFEWNFQRMPALSTLRETISSELSHDMTYDWYRFTVDVDTSEEVPDMDDLTDQVEGLLFAEDAEPEFRIVIPPMEQEFFEVRITEQKLKANEDLIQIVSLVLEMDQTVLIMEDPTKEVVTS